MDQVHENMLHVTKYEVLGKLPNLMTFDDGTPLTDKADWERRRLELYKTAVELQYGTMPPEPEFLEVEYCCNSCSAGRWTKTYRIYTGTRECPVSFMMKLILPMEGRGFPAIVDGDMCFGYHLNPEYLSAALDEGVAWVLFDRTELAHDLNDEGRGKGQLYKTYPTYTFGALGAWAWGYSRCVDALEILFKGKDNPLVNTSLIAFSGHSRGGKTAALAGALDTRAAIVNPNETCAGGCGCYRIHLEGYCEGMEKPHPSETLENIWNMFPFWFGPDMGNYANREQDLPFDSHFLKALVAPRVLFVSEAAGDLWANPVGSWMTTMATKDAYDFLGVPENLYWYFRTGGHRHDVRDVKMLASLIKHMQDPAIPVADGFFQAPFKAEDFPPIY